MPSKDNQYAKLFLQRKHLLNDIGRINYVDGTDSGEGFSQSSTYFCDNIVLWAICHDHPKSDEKKPFVTNVGSVMGTIRSIISKYADKPNLKYIGRGWDREPDTTRRKIHRKKRTALGMESDEYTPGYIAVKMSLSELPLDEVHSLLEFAEEELLANFTVLHDIDIACDCAGITTRALVEEYLLANGVSIQAIIPDKSKVGRDCISWMDLKKRRCKVYNKFVQMLQSCDVRKLLGSLISDLVYNHDPDFTKKLLAYRATGMTRVEMTIYSSRIRSVEWYTKRVNKLFEFLDECPVHQVSFDRQWEQVVERLTSVSVIYITNKSTFAYCHWWNSVTGKMQGYAKKSIDEDDVKKLLANFSFNDRPLYFVKGKLAKEKFKTTEESTWHREEGCDAITLVPGPNRGLYPSYRSLDGEALAFEDVGLGTVSNITIGWPERRIDKRSKALAKISKENGIPEEDEMEAETDDDSESDEDDGRLREINISASGRFTSAHTIAGNLPRVYTVIGYGRRIYYGNLTTYLTTKDGTNIICTKSLQEIAEEEIVHGIHFDIRLIRAKKVNGYRDVECELV